MAKNTFANLAAEYKSLWDNAVIRPEHLSAVKATAQKVRELKPTYDHVSAITKVPWYIVGVIHNLEFSFSMDHHLHNGDPLPDARCRSRAAVRRAACRGLPGKRAQLMP